VGNYSIKELERLSGIKAHTIRIWEQRYKILKPKRTDTHIRIYDDEELKHLLNVALLLKKGFKISKVSKLKAHEINTYLLNLYTVKGNSASIEDKINGLAIAMIELNSELFEKIFSSSVRGIGFKGTMEKLIYPFLQRVGLFWSVGDINPAQEHFISNLIRQKIIHAIDSQLPPTSKKSFLLYLPEGELHEIGLLMTSYLLREAGHTVIYLGQSVPLKAIEDVYTSHQPNNIILFITTVKAVPEIEEYLKKIVKTFPKSTISVSGAVEVLSTVKMPLKIKWLKGIEDLK
jgi:DNA-binding transcriptional MerR regulator